MKTETSKQRASYYIVCAICVFLMFFGGLIPSFSPLIPKVGMQIICLFIGMVGLWIFVGGVWPSVLAIVALGMTEYTNMAGAVASSLGGPATWQILFAFIMTSAITVSGAGDYVGKWALSRSAWKGKPLLFSLVFLLVLSVIAAFGNAVAALLLGWAILTGIAKALDTKITQSYFKCMAVYMMPACVFGEMAIPFKGFMPAFWGALCGAAGAEYSNLGYLAIAIVITVIVDILLVLSMKLLKVDVGILKNYDNTKINEEFQNAKLTDQQSASLIAMAACLAVSLIASLLPATNGLAVILNRLSASGIFAIGTVALLLFKRKNGESFFDISVLTAKSPVWSPVFMAAAAVPIATALASADVGFTAWIGSVVTPVFERCSIFTFYAIVILVSVLLTNVASNIGITMMMLSIAVPTSPIVGASPYMVGIAVILSACCGYLLPSSSGVSAMAYGVKEKQGLEAKDILKYGVALLALYYIVAIIIFPILDKAVGI